MKNKIAIIGALLVSAVINLNAQTTNAIPNLLGSSEYSSLAQQVWDDTIGTSNGVFVVTAARKLTGNANRFSVDYLYSFNSIAGLVIGIDDIRSGNYSQASILKGGLNLQANVYPFKNFGVTNFFLTPYAFAVVTTPMGGTSNNGGIGQLTGTGVSFEQKFSKNLSLEVGGFYENSTGEGAYNGNWIGALAGLHYKF